MIRSILTAIITAASVQASATVGGTQEVIMGVTYDDQGITYQVKSGGCTTKDDFQLLQQWIYPPRVSLLRINEDMCQAYMPYGTKIFYTWAEFGFKQSGQFEIANRLQTRVTVVK